MTEHTPPVLDSWTSDQLLSIIRQQLSTPRKIEVRRSLGDGILWLVFAAVLLTLGGLCLHHFGRVGLGKLFGTGLVLGGMWNLVWGLIWVADRTPVLTLGASALVSRISGAVVHIPWTNISRAQLSRSTRNGAEESAWMTLFLHEVIAGQSRVTISLANLDSYSEKIFGLIGERANLI
jgi:hypothetical protein